MRTPTVAILLTATWSVVGCSTPPDPSTDACEQELCETDDPCSNEVHALGENEHGQIFVPVNHDGTAAWLLLDTGSALSFLFLGEGAPDFVPTSGSVEMGCERLELPGRGFDPFITSLEGRPVVGILGVDVLMAHPTAVNLAEPSMTRFDAAPDMADALRLSCDDALGHLIVPATLNDTTVRLMLDMGAPNTVWLGQAGRPGDEEVRVADAAGNVLSFYLGEAELGLAGDPARSIPLERAPAWPYFEETIAILGGNIHGLLGKSAFAGRTITFGVDPEAVFVSR